MQRQTRRHIFPSRSVSALLERLPICTFLRESLPMSTTMYTGDGQTINACRRVSSAVRGSTII
ncbi:hypothetical protein L210DRAFT_938162, partial [Boletus edulis BED1]